MDLPHSHGSFLKQEACLAMTALFHHANMKHRASRTKHHFRRLNACRMVCMLPQLCDRTKCNPPWAWHMFPLVGRLPTLEKGATQLPRLLLRTCSPSSPGPARPYKSGNSGASRRQTPHTTAGICIRNHSSRITALEGPCCHVPEKNLGHPGKGR